MSPLKAGIYKIMGLGLGRTNVGTIDSVENSISFEVSEDSEFLGFKSYSRSRPGTVVSNFEWKTISYIPIL